MARFFIRVPKSGWSLLSVVGVKLFSMLSALPLAYGIYARLVSGTITYGSYGIALISYNGVIVVQLPSITVLKRNNFE